MSEGKKVLVANVKALGVAQNMVECEIDVEGANVAKILSVQSVPRISNTEPLENEMNYDGIVFVKLFVLCQDGSLKAVSTQHKFQGKLENKTLQLKSKVMAQPKLVDCVVASVSEKGAKVVCSVETHFTHVANNEITVMPFDETQLEIKEKELSTWAVNEVKTIEFETTGEILIPGEDVRVVLIENSIVLKSANTFAGYGVIKGEISSKILYTTGDNMGLMSANTITPFTHEVEILNATKDGMLQAQISLCEEKFKLLMGQDKKQTKATLEFAVCATICEYEKQTSLVIEDVYSTEFESKCTITPFEQSVHHSELYFEKKIEGNVVLDPSQPQVKKLLAVTGATLGAMETTLQDNKLTLVGVAYANMIFDEVKEEVEETEETAEKTELFAPTSLQIEIPFEISEDYLEGGTILGFDVTIDDVDISVKKGKNVFFDAKLKAHVIFAKTDNDSCITSVALMQARKEKEDGIEIVFAKKGFYLWDVAKKLGVSINQLLDQNPNIADPLEKDERLVLYFQCKE